MRLSKKHLLVVASKALLKIAKKSYRYDPAAGYLLSRRRKGVFYTLSGAVIDQRHYLDPDRPVVLSDVDLSDGTLLRLYALDALANNLKVVAAKYLELPIQTFDRLKVSDDPLVMSTRLAQFSKDFYLIDR